MDCKDCHNEKNQQTACYDCNEYSHFKTIEDTENPTPFGLLERFVMWLLRLYASFGRECCFRVHYPDGEKSYWLEYDQAKPLYDLHGGEMEFSQKRFLAT